jgi:predicted dehydrogenase
MAQTSDGMMYAPKGKARPVVGKGAFPFAAMRLDHGHIYGMCNGLTEAGAQLRLVWDPDPAKVKAFLEKFPDTRAARSEDEVLEDREIRLVAAAAIPNERGPLGCRVMEAGKDYFTDKTPFTSMTQLERARAVAKKTGRKYMVYYSERLHNESAVAAGDLVARGAIGRVIHVTGLGPHRLNAPTRPAWFFRKEQYGGILCDIGSHQIEQFLFFAGAGAARVTYARAANYHHPEFPELEDFGEAGVVAGNGAGCYFRVDWFTPDGLSTWGDGRLFILGTDGYIELRKYVNVAADRAGDHLFLVDGKGEHHLELSGKASCPFFGALILDCLERTEKAMTQEHAFLAASLCLEAQAAAERAAAVSPPSSPAGYG